MKIEDEIKQMKNQICQLAAGDLSDLDRLTIQFGWGPKELDRAHEILKENNERTGLTTVESELGQQLGLPRDQAKRLVCATREEYPRIYGTSPGYWEDDWEESENKHV